MPNIIYNQQGEVIFPFDPAEKCAKIKAELTEKIFEPFEAKQAELLQLMVANADKPKQGRPSNKPKKLPQVEPMKISIKLNQLLRSGYGTINNSVALNDFTAEWVKECFDNFMDLISFINDYTTFIPTKQLMCAFLQITESTYNNLLSKRADIDLTTQFENIESYLVDTSFTASQLDQVKESSTLSRLKTKEMGHSLSEKESTQINVLQVGMTGKEAMQSIEKIKQNFLAKPKD